MSGRSEFFPHQYDTCELFFYFFIAQQVRKTYPNGARVDSQLKLLGQPRMTWKRFFSDFRGDSKATDPPPHLFVLLLLQLNLHQRASLRHRLH